MSALRGSMRKGKEAIHIVVRLRGPSSALHGMQAVCGGKNKPCNCFCPHMTVAASKVGLSQHLAKHFCTQKKTSNYGSAHC